MLEIAQTALITDAEHMMMVGLMYKFKFFWIMHSLVSIISVLGTNSEIRQIFQA